MIVSGTLAMLLIRSTQSDEVSYDILVARSEGSPQVIFPNMTAHIGPTLTDKHIDAICAAVEFLVKENANDSLCDRVHICGLGDVVLCEL